MVVGYHGSERKSKVQGKPQDVVQLQGEPLSACWRSSWNSPSFTPHFVDEPLHSELSHSSGVSRSLSLGVTGVACLDDRLLPEGPT